MQIINTELIAHPMNWITVFLMVFIFMVAAAMITGHYRGLSTMADHATRFSNKL